jgi:hypothetical protein
VDAGRDRSESRMTGEGFPIQTHLTRTFEWKWFAL